MVLPLYRWSTPSCVWLIALSKPGKPGCFTGITNSLEWKNHCAKIPQKLYRRTFVLSLPYHHAQPLLIALCLEHIPACVRVCVSRLWSSFVLQHPTLPTDTNTEIKPGTHQQCLPLKPLIKRIVAINFET